MNTKLKAALCTGPVAAASLVRDVKPLRIAIMTTGRFHVGDLAREFSRMGHQVAFYSMVPAGRLKEFGLQPESIRTLLMPVAHWYALTRAAPTAWARDFCAQQLTVAYDRAVAKRLESCDVFIGMSGIAVETARLARERWGARIFIERGSRHILSQKAILATLPYATQVTQWQVERELASYAIADVVTVLSGHCEDSFIEYGYAREKLFRNPLGVKYEDFPPADRRALLTPTVLMAGAWCWRKGADLFSEAAQRMPNVKFIHVGTVSDHSLPSAPNFEHIDKVDQLALKDIYARAHVFCLPSREEGMATVIPQALASGLRVVCSNRTGGEDLIPFARIGAPISVFKNNDIEGLITELKKQLTLAKLDSPLLTSLTEEGRHFLKWKSSAKRYSDRIQAELMLNNNS